MIDLKGNPFYLSDQDIAWVNQTRDAMTLEEKIGQLFVANVREGTIEELEGITDIIPIGGVMYRPLPTEICCKLTNYLKQSKVPMLIAADLEKGGNIIQPNGTKFASQMEIAATGKVEYAQKLATICGTEGGSVGINWTFAPDADIDFNYRNPITNVRTYGSNPETVADMASAYVTTVQKMGMAASVKHFPGDGVDERDHHLVTTVNTLSKEEWDASYGKVYKKCIEDGTLTVMVGHIMQPAIEKYYNPDLEDKDVMPATLSKELMQNCLREQLGFNGLIVTDATTMSGFTIPMPRWKSVPTSIACGADIFLFSRNMKEDVEFMKQGLKNGILTEERLDEAVTRILALKAALHLNSESDRKIYDAEEAEKSIGTREHHEWAKACAKEAITLVKEEEGVLPITPKKYPRVMYYPLTNPASAPGVGEVDPCKMFEELLEKEGFEVTQFNPSKGSEGRVAPMSDFVGKYDIMIYLANFATKSNQTTLRVEWAPPLGANCPHFLTSIPTVFISVENPYHLQDVPRIRTFINTFCSNKEIIEELVEKLTGRESFTGTSPSDPFCDRWDTHL